MSSPRHKFFAASLLQGANKLDSPRPLAVESKVNTSDPPKFGGVKSNDYSSEKIKELLENYNEVQHTEWETLPLGSHIRYLKKDGDFKPGGFIRTKRPDHFILENVPFGSKKTNDKYVHWVMNFENVSKIFSKDKNAPVTSMPVAPTVQQPMPVAPMQAAPMQAAPVSMIPSYNPMMQVENGFIQKQIDDVEKKVTTLEVQFKRVQSDLAELTIIVKNIGKYIQMKGGSL